MFVMMMVVLQLIKPIGGKFMPTKEISLRFPFQEPYQIQALFVFGEMVGKEIILFTIPHGGQIASLALSDDNPTGTLS